MRITIPLTILVALLAGSVLSNGVEVAEERLEHSLYEPPESGQSGYGRGFAPPPFEPHRIDVGSLPTPLLPPPARFDWREQDVVTPVRYQGSCGACYAFAGLADIESKMLMAGEGAFDFSENNLKECEWFGRTGKYPSKCQGGTYWRIINHMAEHGTVLEDCDPYVSYNSVCKTTCDYIKTILDWRVFSLNEMAPVDLIKTHVINDGPIFAAIDAGFRAAWESELNSYDGSYTLYYPQTYIPNHAVLIVGWDDSLSHAGGQGAWICKNSWGTSWGGTAGYGTERGYFTIAYGSANLGTYASFVKEWQDYDPCGRLLFYDEAGYYAATGYGNKTAWAMCKFVMPENMILQRVEFWTTDATADIDVYVYDDFNGSVLSNQLARVTDTSLPEMGYHSIELPSPIGLASGEDVYVAVKFSNVGYTYPLTYDPYSLGPRADNMCYISPTGDAWAEFTDGDLGVRIRVRRDRDDCEPPQKVSLFTAEASEGAVTLRWLNSPDEDFSHVLIKYSTTGYPLLPEEGTAVENGTGGMFYGVAAAADSFVHTGLQNHILYHYSVFAADTAFNYSNPKGAEAMPRDVSPPGPVTGFSAAARGSGSEIALRWTNPTDSDFSYVVINYSTVDYPVDRWDGFTVENGADGKFYGTPALVDSFVHTGLWSDTTYYYSAFAADSSDNCSGAEHASASPTDTLPPGPVSGFSGVPDDRSVKLMWDNPEDSDLAGVLITYSTEGSPGLLGSGVPVENGNDGIFDATPASPDSFIHTGLWNDTTYHYCIWAFDGAGNYSSEESLQAVPRDLRPPEFSISILQNPLITNHLDIYVIPSEAVIETSFVVTIEGEPVEMTASPGDDRVYRYDYEVYESGTLDVNACARDLMLNRGCALRSFGASRILASSGGEAASVDGRMRLSIPGGAFARDTYLIVSDAGDALEGIAAIYSVSPASLELDGTATVSIAYDIGQSNPAHLCIAAIRNGEIDPMESYLDREHGRVVAYAERLGMFGLLYRRDLNTPALGDGELTLLQNSPNPFATTTQIVFALPAPGRVRAEVLSVEGRVVRRMIDGFVTPGRHTLEWDGTDEHGRPMASGIYFYKITADRRSATRKMVILR